MFCVKVPTPGPYSTNSLVFAQSTRFNMVFCSDLDDAITDPTITGCLRKPLRNIAQGEGSLRARVSYWAFVAAAGAGRRIAEHAAIRERGRGVWYRSYSLHVAAIARSYDWQKGCAARRGTTAISRCCSP